MSRLELTLETNFDLPWLIPVIGRWEGSDIAWSTDLSLVRVVFLLVVGKVGHLGEFYEDDKLDAPGSEWLYMLKKGKKLGEIRLLGGNGMATRARERMR